MIIKSINTDRLKLRPISQKDVKIIFDIFSTDNIMIPYGMGTLTSLKQAESLLQTMMNDGEWGIELKDTQKLIGTIGFVSWDENNKRAEIAFELLEDYWNQGFAHEVLNAVVHFFFKETDMNRLQAYVYPSNIGSIKVLEKTGFVKEGYLREYAIKHNCLQDYFLYSILRKDFSSELNEMDK